MYAWVIRGVPHLARSIGAAALVSGCILGLTTASSAGTLLGGAVDGVRAVSTTGSDSNPCTRDAPCLTFNRAYRAAMPGQIVEIAAGAYPGQTIDLDRSKTSSIDVGFRPAAGATVSLSGELTIHASHLEVRDLTIEGSNWHVRQGADDVTLRNVKASRIFITSASNVRVLGGEVGPAQNADPQIKTSSESAPVPTNILIDGVYFHDIVRTNPAAHTECLQIMAGNGIVIRNSRFERCATHGVFINPFLTDRIRNLLIENNWFAATLEGFYALRIGECENALVRNNSAGQNMINSPSATCSSQWYGNIMPSKRRDQCGSDVGATWDYNVYGSGTKCGPNDVVGPSGFASETDFHLTRGAAAIGRGNPDSHPAHDYDRQGRPTGAPPDAGADQREPVAVVVGRSIGAVRLGMPRKTIVGFYGSGDTTLVRQGAKRLERTRYAVVAGRLTVTYDTGRVAAVSTTSPYYRTPGGISVGASVPDSAPYRWSPCARSYHRSTALSATDLVPVRGRAGLPIASISITLSAARRCGTA